MLTEEQVSTFQNLYKKSFDKNISRDEAQEQGIKLIRLVELIYKPMKEEEYKRVQENLKKI